MQLKEWVKDLKDISPRKTYKWPKKKKKKTNEMMFSVTIK